MNQVLLEVFEANPKSVNCTLLSRKLAVLCYYLNTRLDGNVRFNFGGVIGTSFSVGYVGGAKKTSFALVVNQKYVIDNAFFLQEDSFTDEEFRNFTQNFLKGLALLAPEFSSFTNFKFSYREPLVVGEVYLVNSNVDGRLLKGSSSAGFNNSTRTVIAENPSVRRLVENSVSRVENSSVTKVVTGETRTSVYKF
jgi:hypothetical protein